MDDFKIFLKTQYGIDQERFDLLPESEQKVILDNYDYTTNDVWKDFPLIKQSEIDGH